MEIIFPSRLPQPARDALENPEYPTDWDALAFYVDRSGTGAEQFYCENHDEYSAWVWRDGEWRDVKWEDFLILRDI